MFFKLVQISKNFSKIFTGKNPCISGLMQFKLMLFKGNWIHTYVRYICNIYVQNIYFLHLCK